MEKSKFIQELSNCKIYVNGKQQQILDKLNELGSFSYCKSSKITISNPFLYIIEGVISGNDNMIAFSACILKEINMDWILQEPIEKDLSIDWNPKPFEKVLANNDYDGFWYCDFYSHKSKNGYACVSGWFDDIIPFNDNEHLLGTADKPKIKYNIML